VPRDCVNTKQKVESAIRSFSQRIFISRYLSLFMDNLAGRLCTVATLGRHSQSISTHALSRSDLTCNK
jgi:hypothetical protein